MPYRQPTLHHKLHHLNTQELLVHFSYFLPNLQYIYPHFCNNMHLFHVSIRWANFPHIFLRLGMYKYQSHFYDPYAITHHRLPQIYMCKYLFRVFSRLGIYLDISLHWHRCRIHLRRIDLISSRPYKYLCWERNKYLFHFYNLGIVRYITLRQDSLSSDILVLGFLLDQRIERGIIISRKGDESVMEHDYFDEKKQPSCLNSIY